MPQFLGLLSDTEDEGLDRLGADRPQPDLKAALEPAGYLFGRPAFGQPIQNKALQFNVPLKDRRALAA